MIVTSVQTGPLEVNCYILADEETGKAIVVDPGDDPETIVEAIKGLDVRVIVLTHGHFDHVGAVPALKEKTGAKLALHQDEREMYAAVTEQGAIWGFKMPPMPPPDILLKEGDTVDAGELSFTVIHTPGHSPGSISLYATGVVLTGDTLFMGSVGRTDFPGGSMPKLKQAFKRLMSLPDDTAVLPGHGPATTIGREKAENFFSAEVYGT